MKVDSDDIKKAAEQNIDQLNDYGESDPFTETPEFEKMMDEVYASIKKNIKKRRKKKKSLRFIAVIAAAMSLLLVTLALNASAIGIFLFKSYIDIRGEFMQIETDEADIRQQYDSISNFRLKEKILIPGWLPKGTELVGIFDNNYNLMLKYKYGENEIVFSQEIISKNTDNSDESVFLERSDYDYIENFDGEKSVYFMNFGDGIYA